MRLFSMGTIAAVGVLALASAVWADDAYYQVRLDDLKITDGKRPQTPSNDDWRQRELAWCMLPYAVIEGDGEVFVHCVDSNRFGPWSMPELQGDREAILVRTKDARDVAGTLYYPKPDWSGMAAVKFTIPAAAAKADNVGPFLKAKEAHYEGIMARGIPGAAWFRHEARQARMALSKQSEGKAPAQTPAQEGQQGPISDQYSPAAGESGLAESYALFTGGRAVSENLQLDRLLRPTKDQEATVDIDTLQGISVPEIDWQPLVKDLQPKLDPLAALIPADQHVIFFPTFSAAVLVSDQAERQGTPILQLAEPRSEDARTAARYQQQLCLSLTGLGRLLGPQVAASIAVTGSDPYLRTGSDVAVLFEAPNPAMLETLLLAQINLAAGKEPQAKPEQGKIADLAYRGVRSPDRSICSYVARLDHAVVVTNSLVQLERLAKVGKKELPAIASLPEYVFFRNRYQLGDAEETALVFLSDATIRRWCGPRWRIGASRRLRDIAVLAELQAANLPRLVKGDVQPGPIYTDLATADVGELTLNAKGVHSAVQGSLAFMTPIVEIPLSKVSKVEADAYQTWRNGYQRNWRWAFDPIALRITLQQDRLAGDLTVMPLIMGTEYRQFVSISQGAQFAPDAGDPHDALVHFILAINAKGPQFRQAENFLSTMSKGVTLGWLGSSVAVYVDDDPVWQELAKVPSRELESSLSSYIGRLPIAVRAEVSNGLRLTAFLASLRAFVEQTAPGMTQWESLTYKDQPYVKISPTERAKGQTKELENVAIYYVAGGDALLVTLHEKAMQHAIDRQLARADGDKATPAATRGTGRPWLGGNLGLQVDRKAIDLIGLLHQDDSQRALQARAWGNLPILNEWKRRYPDQDPVALHQRLWQIGLICPGGGNYVWNDRWQTMESTVFGHPGEPKKASSALPALQEFSNGSFGLTFENQGLRARVSLERAKPAEKLAQ